MKVFHFQSQINETLIQNKAFRIIQSILDIFYKVLCSQISHLLNEGTSEVLDIVADSQIIVVLYDGTV